MHKKYISNGAGGISVDTLVLIIVIQYSWEVRLRSQQKSLKFQEAAPKPNRHCCMLLDAMPKVSSLAALWLTGTHRYASHFPVTDGNIPHLQAVAR